MTTRTARVELRLGDMPPLLSEPNQLEHLSLILDDHPRQTLHIDSTCRVLLQPQILQPIEQVVDTLAVHLQQRYTDLASTQDLRSTSINQCLYIARYMMP
jgi:hypothetical protein